MSYFPAFINLKNKHILLVGGGNIASKKIDKLLDFTTNITIITPKLCTTMQQIITSHQLQLKQRFYKNGDIKGFDIVIVATNDLELQQQIYRETKDTKILFHCVDFPQLCDFIFPSYIKEEELIIAISTSSTLPAFAKQLRNYIKKQLPSDLFEQFKNLQQLRKKLPKGEKRRELLIQKAKEIFS